MGLGRLDFDVSRAADIGKWGNYHSVKVSTSRGGLTIAQASADQERSAPLATLKGVYALGSLRARQRRRRRTCGLTGSDVASMCSFPSEKEIA